MGILDRRLPPRVRPVGHVDAGSPSAEAEAADDFDAKLADLKAKLNDLQKPAPERGDEASEADEGTPARPARDTHRWRLYVSGAGVNAPNLAPKPRPMTETEWRTEAGGFGGYFYTEAPAAPIERDTPVFRLDLAAYGDPDPAVRAFAGEFAHLWAQCGGLTITGDRDLARALLTVAIEYAPQIPAFPCSDFDAIALELLTEAPRRERIAYESAWERWKHRGA